VEVPGLEIALAINNGAVSGARENQQAEPSDAGADKCDGLVHLVPDVVRCATIAERQN